MWHGRLALVLGLAGLTACGSGSLGSLGSLGSANPFGGRGAVAETTEEREAATVALSPVAGTLRLERVLEARLEQGLRGAILRVDGLAPVDGYHSAELVRVEDPLPDDGEDEDEAAAARRASVLRYELRAVPPAVPGRAGSVVARTLSAAAFVPATTLSGLRVIEVISASNTVSLRPR